MRHFLSTREAAKRLGLKPGTITMAIYDGRLDPPERGPGGCYLWTDDDLQRAAAVFDRRHVLKEAVE